MAEINGLMRGPNGEASSKRWFGAICLAVAITGFFMGKDSTGVCAFLAAAAAVFSAMAVSKT